MSFIQRNDSLFSISGDDDSSSEEDLGEALGLGRMSSPMRPVQAPARIDLEGRISPPLDDPMPDSPLGSPEVSRSSLGALNFSTTNSLDGGGTSDSGWSSSDGDSTVELDESSTPQHVTGRIDIDTEDTDRTPKKSNIVRIPDEIRPQNDSPPEESLDDENEKIFRTPDKKSRIGAAGEDEEEEEEESGISSKTSSPYYSADDGTAMDEEGVVIVEESESTVIEEEIVEMSASEGTGMSEEIIEESVTEEEEQAAAIQEVVAEPEPEKKRGLFGALRGRKRSKSVDKDKPGEKKRGGLFGSLRSRSRSKEKIPANVTPEPEEEKVVEDPGQGDANDPYYDQYASEHTEEVVTNENDDSASGSSNAYEHGSNIEKVEDNSDVVFEESENSESRLKEDSFNVQAELEEEIVFEKDSDEDPEAEEEEELLPPPKENVDTQQATIDKDTVPKKPERRGLFSSFRRYTSNKPSSSPDSSNATNPDDKEKDRAPRKPERRGLFTSFRRYKVKQPSSSQDAAEVVVPDGMGKDLDGSGSNKKSSPDSAGSPPPIERKAGPFGTPTAEEEIELDASGGPVPTDDELEASEPRKLFTEEEGVDGEVDDEPRDEKENIDGADKHRFDWTKLSCLLCTVAFIIIPATFGTAFYGTELAIERSERLSANGGGAPAPVDPAAPAMAPALSPAMDPILVPTLTPVLAETMAPSQAPSECINRDNYLMEFRLTFDSRPAHVGFTLYEAGKIGTGIWVMEPGSFQSFAQLQRKNIFRICLSRTTSYIFTVTDTQGDGLVSAFGATNVTGSWELQFEREIIASYNGDCKANITDVMELANDKTLFECGYYCSCDFLLGGNTTGGSCKQTCDEEPTTRTGPRRLLRGGKLN